MYAFRSLLLSAISLLVLTRVDFASATIYNCRMPPQFSVENADHNMADFYQSRLTVNVPDENYAILTYPASKTITFRIHNVVVNFNGNVVYDTPGHRSLAPKPVSQTFYDRISGVAQRMKINHTDSDISDCHVYLLPVGGDSRFNVSSAIANDVRRVAESCVHSLVCLKLGKLNTRYRTANAHPKSLALLPGLTGPNPYIRSFFGPTPVQHAVGEIVDEGLKRLAGLGETQIQVPKIAQQFTDNGELLGFQIQETMEALNGTFSDLTALTRTSTPTISHEGLRFMIGSKFSINAPKIHYKYRLKQGRRASMGEMTATIDAVDLEGSSVADYSVTPCQLSLEYLKVTNFHNVKHSLRSVGTVETAPTTRNWFTKKVLGAIGQSIEQNLRYILDSHMWSADCEKYRP